jgi:hypothetical protein
MCNSSKITPEIVIRKFNWQQKSLTFTITQETYNQISYLDLNLDSSKATSKLIFIGSPQ